MLASYLAFTRIDILLSLQQCNVISGIPTILEYLYLLTAQWTTEASSCCSEEVKGAEGTEEEPLLDYVILAAIAGVCFWWFFMMKSDSDKIPEVVTGTLNYI